MIIVIIGAQWGDEGKGKVVDLLADRFDIVARYQGGHNAGHSVYVGERAFVLRLLPSGIIHEDKTCVLGNGMVIDPKAFFEEVDQMAAQGISVTPERLKVSSRAHLIMPYHRALDHTSEERLGNEKIGTTLRGIGPAYEDKAGRRGIRVSDALSPEVLKLRIERNLEEANRIIVLYGQQPLRADEILAEISPLVERLRPFVTETSHFLVGGAKREEKDPARRRPGDAAGCRSRHLSVCDVVEPDGRAARRSARASRRITSRAFWALSAPMRRGSARGRSRRRCSTPKRIWRILYGSAATSTAR